MNLLTKQKETHKLRELTYCCRGEEIVREFWMDMYALLYLKWITSKDLLYSTWHSAQCYVAAWMGGEFGGEWIPVYVWLSPFAVHVKPSQHCFVTMYVLVAQSYPTLCNPMDCSLPGSSVHGILQAKIQE